MKLNSNKRPKSNSKMIVNQIALEQNNQEVYQQYNHSNPYKQNNKKNVLINNNINNNTIYNTQIYENINNNDENQYLSKSNIIQNNYNNINNDIGYGEEINYQNNPYGGMRNSKSNDNIISTFEILENNPETFTKIINNENDKVYLEFTIINKSNKAFPGNGKSKLVFYKNNISLIKEINLRALNPGQKEKIKINFNEEKFYGKFNIIMMGLKIEGKLIDKPIAFKVIDKILTIEDFRIEYNLSEDDFSDERLLDILKKYDYKSEDAFDSMFN